MKRKWIQWILVYVLWIITAGLGFLCLISARTAVDKMTFLILGILWLVLVIFAEHYYREALPKKTLWKHFSLITAIELFFLSGSHLMPILIISKTNVYGGSFLLPVIELIGGVIFFEQYKFY